ncbi:MAG TPA: GNAT family N-acetyltransferase [Thermoplasmata archaeon]|nr:GNAT family N-acetyltransferase [Thermoplasmata archaeon]
MTAHQWHEVEDHPQARYRSADWSTDLEKIRAMFQEYRRWVAEHSDPLPASAPRVKEGLALLDDLTGRLPGAYGPPRGDVLLWFEKDDVVACGALRETAPKIGEMKRIQIRSDYRGEEFGKPFVRAMIARARELGYARLRSDTLGSMTSAIEFHEALGFHRIPAFWPHPADGTIFFERDLEKG